jgi:hypothetical protein
VIENYGPRHAKAGYKVLGKNGQTFRLTWKGAFLMTWRGLWPTSVVRKVLQQKTMHSELQALPVGGDGVAEGLGFGAPCLECALFGNL